MAYAYNRVFAALGKSEDEQPQSANIFEGGGQGGAQPGTDRVQAASAEGSMAGGGGGGSCRGPLSRSGMR